MHHQFFLKHPEFVLPRSPIHPAAQTLEIMRGCATQKSASLHIPLEPDRASIETSSLILRLWLREHMRPHRHIKEVDKRLIRVVHLQRLIQRFRGRRMNADNKRHLCARIGQHLQRELTLLLLETPVDFHSKLLACQRFNGIDAGTWTTSLLGASGEAYALRALVQRPNARVFLPEPAEDLFDATDLFWLESGQLHAISVKSYWGPGDQARAIRVAPGSLEGFRGWANHHLRSIREGSIRHSKRIGVSCVPIALRVRTTRGSLVHLRRTWGLIPWPNQVMGQPTPQIQSA